VASAAASSTASAQIIAQDDFSTYNAGSILGQTGKTIDEAGGEIIGFGSVTDSTATTWQGGGGSADTGALVIPSIGRTSRAFASSVSSVDTGTVLISADVALGTTAGDYEAFEIATTAANGDYNAIRIFSNDGSTFQLGYASAAGILTSGATALGTNDDAAHDFLLAIDFDTDTVTAYEDPASNTSIPATGGVSLSFDPSFTLGGVNLAAYGTNASSSVDNFIAETPEPATWAMMLGGLGLLVALRRFRAGSMAS